MKSHYYNPSIFETFNARHLNPNEVAKTFVPPIEIFSTLSTRNNHVLIGPRGSGKTTLLKMLTIPALKSWSTARYQDTIPKTDFIGIFVAADNTWRTQIRQESGVEAKRNTSIGKSAFTTHVLISFIQALQHIKLAKEDPPGALKSLPKPLSREEEAEFVRIVSPAWSLHPKIESFGGLIIALRQRMIELKTMRDQAAIADDPERFIRKNAPYCSLDFRSSVSLGIDTYESLTSSAATTWALLFDEFEVAPPEIQRDVLENLRGSEDTRIIYKVALAPYNKNFISNFSEVSPTAGNDFNVIDLCYPNKERSYGFSERLLTRLLEDEGLEEKTISEIFGRSAFDFPEHGDANPYDEDGVVGRAFTELAGNDNSFANYIKRKSIDLNDWKALPESKRAQIRKVRSIVVTRSYFRRPDKAGSKSTSARSRKIHTIYTGYPTILALCEGNPRILIGIMTPLVRELKRTLSSGNKGGIDKRSQSKQVRNAITSFRSLLKTIPFGSKESPHQRGLLKFLDQIGNYFFDKNIKAPFNTQPPLTFTVDSNTAEPTLDAIGRALNAGAIIFVPDPDSDPILGSLRGKRFRLSYLLAAYYKLPIMLNSSVSLSSILHKRTTSEPDLFDKFGIKGDE